MANDPEGAVLLEAGMAASGTGQPQPAPRRRRGFFRVSVRGLLLLVLVIGCGLGWIVQIVRAGQVQRRAVAAIYQAGGWVVYDTVWDEDQNTSTWKPRWPKWLVDQLGVDYFGNVVFINLHDRGTDEVLAHVARLKHLKQLHRPGLAVTDAGLVHLGRLSDLRLLSLDHTQVTDAGLAHLKGLSGLKWLKLTRTRVTDAGVADLQKSLPHLQATR
jgi:internalin A